MADTIIDRIKAETIRYIEDTGKDPVFLYLGRKQMKILLEWAKNNVYVPENTGAEDLEGSSRPVIHGCLIYHVNEEDHFRCSH
jgi:hypothetical protein